jgi:transposase
MTRPISIEIREKIVKAYKDSVGTPTQIAKMFDTTARSVHRFVQRYRERGDLTPDPLPGRPPILTEENLKIIEKIILKKLDGTLNEHRDEFEKQTNISVTYVTIHNACKILDLRLKKKVSMQQSKQGKTSK